MKKIVALISGRGSNLQALVTACAAEQWPARFVSVFSNDACAAGLAWASGQGIEARSIDHRSFERREQFDEALALAIDGHSPDLVLLAGFMRVLGPAFVRRFEGRLLNIHPSLLPSFKGLNTHARALEAGVKIHGATVHLVSAELDSGAILAQAATPVFDEDTPQSLAQAVLAAEHRVYPMVVAALVRGELVIERDAPRWRDPLARASALWVPRRPEGSR